MVVRGSDGAVVGEYEMRSPCRDVQLGSGLTRPALRRQIDPEGVVIESRAHIGTAKEMTMSGGWPTARYEFRIRLGAHTQKIVVEADTATNAKAMVEAQYSREAIVWGPHRLP